MRFSDIVIVGAGPNGLSLAAHLADAGADFRVFGKPMDTWRAHVPKGMQLKSDGFASNLSAPDPASTLKSYCALRNLPYDDKLIPVPLEIFAEYSAWWQKRYAPMLEEQLVTSLAPSPRGFVLTLEDGEVLEAAKVVLAVGITHFPKMPDEARGLPPDLVSHSFDHHELTQLAGKKVVILGGGSSAVDTAVLAADAGADVAMVARRPLIHYHAVPDPDAVSWLSSLSNPSSGIGPGWRSFFCTKAPRLFRRLPKNLRLEATRRHLGPAPGWFMRGKLEGRVKTHLGQELDRVQVKGDKVIVTAHDRDGKSLSLEADHVIAATGYRPDIRALPFLDRDLAARIDHLHHTPNLSDNFESSVPGLFMVGPVAANAFGPLMRFMVACEYIAPRVAAHLLRSAKARRAVA